VTPPINANNAFVNNINNQPIFRGRFPKLNLFCQNVCSLNVSRPSKKTYCKIAVVTRGGSDVVFLSDTRLNSNKQTSALHDIDKKFKFLGYNFFHNSTTNSRGTAMLVSTRLDCVAVDEYRDAACNILLKKFSFGGVTITLGSIYGPNNDDKDFFSLLEEKIRNFDSDCVIIGGDWNCTLDTRANRQNIDTYNTVGIPSQRRSIWLNSLCRNIRLIDPFRHFYPEKLDFTYVPFAENAINRSRLDFFLI
jgi:exonuclease III